MPVAHTDYDTTVFEGDQQLFVKQTAMEQLKQDCLKDCSSYEGRRMAVTFRTGIERKAPIPINFLLKIYAFPTHSPKNPNCSWLFPAHIHSITANPKDAQQSIITFKNGRSIVLNTPAIILNKQMHRTTYCIYVFS
ncbi:competence protein ComK [Bacillus tamaricis]|uniref:Competence protein ComK n=1 Tax=Evansella tamaricis TaxID=2069301 RepID=A0ABS6JDC2_9BACI|nr:competence protein ComK [Evansella tamaricis]